MYNINNGFDEKNGGGNEKKYFFNFVFFKNL